ncbi:uncharacterized protein LOC143259620 isoform X3 [Megalopta genalis]|uniref:uncharacterized protein LOC143259620 isoform X3 n=1 Tax=Megalopta genalis TaxID=115081 RepID=UPI003FD019B3
MSACDTHYELSVRLMRILGLWPYVSETTRRIQTTLVNIICSLLVIVQITPIVTGGIDTMVLLQSLSTIIMVLGSVVKFNAFLFLTSAVSADQITVNITRRIVGSDGKDDYKMQIRQMTDSVKNMWNTTHKDTLEILERRAILGKQQGAIYATSTEVITFPLVTDYLVEEQTYLLYIVIHQSLSFFFIGTIYVATETLFIMWLQHTISMYELFSYFIQKATVARPSHVSKKLMDTYRKNCLASAVIYHTEAKVFMSFLKTELSFSYAVLLVFAVVSLSINLFRISVALCKTHDMQEMLMALFFSISELVYMFYLNYIVQHLSDYTDNLTTLIYSTPWYETPVSMQKQLLIIMIRCSERFVFDFYGFYNASIEGFSGLVRCTMSYFMMMTSLH